MDDDPASAAKLKQYRQRAGRHEAEIKEAILKWLKPRENEADNVSITRALLGIALDRHVAVHHADGFDLIEAAYRRAVEKWRGTLQ